MQYIGSVIIIRVLGYCIIGGCFFWGRELRSMGFFLCVSVLWLLHWWRWERRYSTCMALGVLMGCLALIEVSSCVDVVMCRRLRSYPGRVVSLP
jgi:hypothetical protein